MGQSASQDSAPLLETADKEEEHTGLSSAAVEVPTVPDESIAALTAIKSASSRIDESGGAPITLAAHDGTVNDCAVSLDGTWLLTVGADGSAKIWDSANGKLSLELHGHEGEVRSCAIFPDGRRALTTGEDGTVRIWNVSSGTLESTLQGHEGPVFCSVIFPDGLWAVTTGSDCQAIIWDLSAGDVLRLLPGPEDPRYRMEPFGAQKSGDFQLSSPGGGAHSCAISPDGKRVALIGGDTGDFAAALWDAGNGEQICELEGRCCFGCAFFPDGQRLVTVSEEWQVHEATVWDIASEEKLCSISGQQYINGCAVFPRDDLVISVGDDGLGRVWRASRQRPDEGSIQVCAFDCGETQVLSCAIFPGGRHVVTTSSDGSARIWAMPE